MKPPKPKPMNPSEWWAVVNSDGGIATTELDSDSEESPVTFAYRKDLRVWLRKNKRPGDRVTRVLMTEVANGR